MFYEISKEKLIIMSAMVTFVFLLVVTSVTLNNKFKITGNSRIMVTQSKADLSYLLKKNNYDQTNDSGNKVFAFGIAGAENAVKNILSKESVVYNAKNSSEKSVAKSIPVLVYHGIPSEGEGFIPQDKFIEQMRTLKQEGWQTVRFDDFKKYMKGEIELPDKSFLLTFDDGRKDSFYPVDPVLKDMGYSAVMFVISGQSLPQDKEMESHYYLSPLELKKMVSTGRWELQSHGKHDHEFFAIDEFGTKDHFLSNRLWLSESGRLETIEEYKSRISRDLTESKSEIENTLGVNVSGFAYPFGDFGQASVNFKDAESIVPEVTHGVYDLAFYQVFKSKGESFNYPDPNEYMIKRINPSTDWSGERLMQEINAGKAKELPYYNTEFGIEWKDSWGDAQIGQDLWLRANEKTTGASAFLNGSYLWKDYVFTANVNWMSGSNVLLMARHKDNENNIMCDFSHDNVKIKKRMNGLLTTIATAKNKIPVGELNLPLSIAIKGNNVECYVNDKLIIESPVYGGLPHGGVGIQIWDSLGNNAAISVNFVQAEGI